MSTMPQQKNTSMVFPLHSQLFSVVKDEWAITDGVEFSHHLNSSYPVSVQQIFSTGKLLIRRNGPFIQTHVSLWGTTYVNLIAFRFNTKHPCFIYRSRASASFMIDTRISMDFVCVFPLPFPHRILKRVKLERV